MAKFDPTQLTREAERYVVREVQLTVEVSVSQALHPHVKPLERAKEIFEDLKVDATTDAIRDDYNLCGEIIECASIFGGDLEGVYPGYNCGRKKYVIDLCFKFDNPERSDEFRNNLYHCVSNQEKK